jgi:hypothetical protein
MSASLEIAVIIGKVIIAKITPAGSIPGPVGELLKIGIQPKVELSHFPQLERMGMRTKIPQMPYTTLGIAASNSTRNTITVFTWDGKKFSLSNTAVPTPIGTAMSKPMKELMRVP